MIVTKGRNDLVHLRHCFQGEEYPDGCKYGDPDCPAKYEMPAWYRWRFMTDNGWSKWEPIEVENLSAFRDLMDDELKTSLHQFEALYLRKGCL